MHQQAKKSEHAMRKTFTLKTRLLINLKAMLLQLLKFMKVELMSMRVPMGNKKVLKELHQLNDLKSLSVKFQDMNQLLLMKKNFKIISSIQSKEKSSIDRGKSNKCAKCRISLDLHLVNLESNP